MGLMGGCPDCGRLISFNFPIHECVPTASWKKENPRIRFIVKASGGTEYGGGYLAGDLRTRVSFASAPRKAFTLSDRQADAIRFPSFHEAELAAEKFDSVSPPPVKRLKLKAKKARR